MNLGRVFIDHELLVVTQASGGSPGMAPPAPDAVDALRHLSDGGHELVLVGPAPVEIGDSGPPVRWQTSLGSGRASGWYLTADVHRCASARRRGLRTILVGPPAPTTMAPERCDREARDLSAAALEILATDAMGGTGGWPAAGGPPRPPSGLGRWSQTSVPLDPASRRDAG
jgi:hypothetical protein